MPHWILYTGKKYSQKMNIINYIHRLKEKNQIIISVNA